MIKPRALIFSGLGLNCEDETKFAFELAGGEADIVHLNDLVKSPAQLENYQIIAFPGGFSYGDDTGSGKAYGNTVKEYLGDGLETFLSRDTLMIAICNGFQIATNIGVLPGALIHNDSARYICRWVDVEVKGKSPWLNGVTKLSLPVAHGEGKFVGSAETFEQLKKDDAIALCYTEGEITKHFNLPTNPNGSTNDIAGITARNGRVLGLMPHPERAVRFTQLPHWTYLRAQGQTQDEGPGIQLFKNAVKYFA